MQPVSLKTALGASKRKFGKSCARLQALCHKGLEHRIDSFCSSEVLHFVGYVGYTHPTCWTVQQKIIINPWPNSGLIQFQLALFQACTCTGGLLDSNGVQTSWKGQGGTEVGNRVHCNGKFQSAIRNALLSPLRSQMFRDHSVHSVAVQPELGIWIHITH